MHINQLQIFFGDKSTFDTKYEIYPLGIKLIMIIGDNFYLLSSKCGIKSSFPKL